MYVLDGKAFAGLEESGQQHSENAVDECMLLQNNQVKQAIQVQETACFSLLCGSC